MSAKKRARDDGKEGRSATKAKRTPPLPPISEERQCAEALMLACNERLGKQSPAALMACDTYLARDFWTDYMHPPITASECRTCGCVAMSVHGDMGFTTMPDVAPLRGHRIHDVACGEFHAVALLDDGELWTAGNNFAGQLGLGDTERRHTFVRVPGFRNVATVACTGRHVLALLETGELYTWGWNGFGQLGLGDTTSRLAPTPVTALNDKRVVAIACGLCHSAATTMTGKLFVWGDNRYGQLGLGLGGDAERHVPTPVAALEGKRVVSVACGRGHTTAILGSGELFVWGADYHKPFGLVGPVEIKNTPQFVEAFRDRLVAAVTGGWRHILVLLKTGEVFAWGWNSCGQLGLGTIGDPVCTPHQVHFFDDKCVKSIHCGAIHSGAVLESGELFTWGCNNHGELGFVDQPVTGTPTLVGTLAGKRVLGIAFGSSFTIARVQ